MKITAFVLSIIFVIAISYWFGSAITRNRIETKKHNELVRAIRTYVESDDSTHHTCIDSTHARCDGECVCDGMECLVKKRDYEIELYGDTLWVFDGDRPVGRYISNWHNQIDTILLKDNQ
jgi:hypothetical protein